MDDAEALVAYTRETRVCNKEGLHFRPIMRLVDLAQKYSADLALFNEDRKADARSPMELLMLVATVGTTLKVVGDGPDECDAVDKLVELIDSGFDETIDPDVAKKS